MPDHPSDPELPDVPALRVLAPPPGGLTRLRARVDAEEQRAGRWWRIAVPALAAAALLVLVVLRSGSSTVPAPTVPPVAFGAPVMPDPAMGGTFYWVASTPADHAPAQHRPAPSSLPTIDGIGHAPVTLVP